MRLVGLIAVVVVCGFLLSLLSGCAPTRHSGGGWGQITQGVGRELAR